MSMQLDRDVQKRSVAVVGAGGNIGSHLVPHLGRIACVGRVLLIDPDRYAQSNLRSQDIGRRDIGKTKVAVQRRRLAEINPTLEIEALAERIESVPLGRLRVDAIMTGLDTRRSRMVVNEISRRLRTPWIDAGVQAEGLLARISSYHANSDSPCLECAFGPDDYAAVEQIYPCRDVTTPATSAPSYLGGVVGAMAAAECDRLFNYGHTVSWGSQEVVLDLGSGRSVRTSLQRNSRCRVDHESWVIERLATGPRELTFGDAISLVTGDPATGACTLQLEGHPFITRMSCLGCRYSRHLMRLSNRLRGRDLRCPRCGGAMLASALDRQHTLTASGATFKRVFSHSLQRAGFRPGDVITLCNGDEVFRFELGD